MKELKFIGGNMGALRTIKELQWADPTHYENHLATLEMMGLYADRLYMLWNDSCNRNIGKFIKVLNAYRKGIVTKKDIEERILNVGWGKSFDDLILRSPVEDV